MSIIPAGAQITLHRLDSACLVQVIGDVNLLAVGDLRLTLQAALDHCVRIIVDLSRAGTVESLGLSMLLAAGSVARRNGGALVLAAPPLLRSRLSAVRDAASLIAFDSVPRALSALSAAADVAVMDPRYGEVLPA